MFKLQRQLVLRSLLCALGMALAPWSAHAQMSPGPLSSAHAEFGGNRNCLKCHGLGKGSLDEHCLKCHEGIAWLREQGRGLHAREADGECANCHPEHAGVDFDLVDFDDAPEEFDHARAGWTLDGAHARTACRDCHRSDHITASLRLRLQAKQPEQGWLGLDPRCSTCHADYHEGSLSGSCDSCHDTGAWRPADGFDHSRARYALDGRHLALSCDACHRSARLELSRDEKGGTKPLFRPLAHAECSACHTDPHRGRLDSACSRCHVTDGFQIVGGGDFDHRLTRFPLRGRHRSVACEACHDETKAWGKRPPFERCDSCHEDAHAGSARLAGAAVDCGDCHDASAFAPSTLTPGDHARFRFALEGAHARIRCDACHSRNPAGVPATTLGRAGVWLQPRFERCTDCHENGHGEQLAHRPDRDQCDACHGFEAWRPSLFSAEQHANAGVPLEGAHVGLQCGRCHALRREGLPELKSAAPAAVALALPSRACESCHRDVHDGRFGAGESWTAGAGCLRCHDQNRFSPADIDIEAHAALGFPLRGAHRAVPCFVCHEELLRDPPGASLLAGNAASGALRFGERREACADCHQDPHGGQFAGESGRCNRCHGEDAFLPASGFDHQRDARFALDGAHQRVPCGACHTPRVSDTGDPLVLYRPLPHECLDCHAELLPGGSNPSLDGDS